MKKYISILLAAVMAVCCLSACGQNNSNTNTQAKDNNDKQVKVVTTVFPEYDWVKEIAGDEVSNMDLTMLLDNGVDLHSYQPTADDIMKISDCDLFIYVGGESDAWVEDALKEAYNKDMKVINLLDVLGSSVKEEEVVEGMEAEEEEAKDGAEEEVEYDEHVWLSLRNAKVLCKAIADNLAEIDTENANTYQKNEKAYADKLDELDFIEDAYIMEVSSPGLGRPLKKEKDYVRSMGKEVEIRTYRPINKEKEFYGILSAYDESSVTITTEDQKEQTFEKADIALIRLAFDF